ncbi:HAD family phosphatase [Baekduia sp.]|jgi:HAD superfamily hydrolase (TIGR01509 family)|uniref:HAD family hydrolase n=1 Tax=Baekduia sp. TaxID=2600305 RepID=UPI002E02A906|nr:HAD family phosphatase [Baekduia sp.]
MSVAAIVLDLDGVVVDTEEVWDRERRAYVDAHGGTWTEKATRKMQGMSSAEWAAYLRDKLGASGEVEEISAAVAAGVVSEIERELPLLPGAIRAINALANAFPLALASSANREVIEAVLEGAGVTERFGAIVSSEEVAHGKPAPDVYLEAARRLGIGPTQCAAVEDSSNGLRSAHAAGMVVIATPNHAFPPAPDALALATVVVDGIKDVTPELVTSLQTP